jgi:hypothetical protein
MRNNATLLEKLALAFILLLTFFLCIKQAIPFNSFDELEIMNWIKNLDDRLFPALKYPPLFIYINYLLSWLYAVFLTLLGIIDASASFLSTGPGFRFTLEAGRIASALFTTALVYMVYRTGKEFFSKSTGFLAALLIASNYLVILYGHIFKPEILVTLLLTVTLYFMLKFHHTGRPVYILWASVFCGLATAAKFNAVFIVPAIVLAVLITPVKTGSTKKTYVFLFTGTIMGFLAGAPNWAVRPLGNLKKLLTQYRPDSGALFQQFEPRSILDIYQEFTVDLAAYFGLIFVVILAAALVTVFINRNKRDILVTFFIIIYIAVFAVFGYYAGRFSLPVYPAAALLMSKVLLVDIKKLLQRYGLLPRFQGAFKYAALLLWFAIAAFALDNTITNVKTYNLLKTQNLWDRILEYRDVHNIDDSKYNAGRQLFTPRFPNSNIKITRGFYLKFAKRHGKKILHFIQAHLPMYEEYMRAAAGSKKPAPGLLDLKPYMPFYKIQKRRCQPWRLDTVFLYRLPDHLAGIQPGNQAVDLPRTFYASRHTSFLPLQAYEKNPNFGKLDEENRGVYRHWLYSKKELKQLNIWLFSFQRNSRLIIRVNNAGLNVRKRGRPPVERLEVKNLRPKWFYYDYVYEVHIQSVHRRIKRKPYYIVLEPVYVDDGASPAASILPRPAAENIPRLFSKKKYPLWMIVFYKKTGIDLSLLSYVSTHTLFENSEGRAFKDEVTVDFTPLEQGDYRLRLEGEPMVPAHPLGTGAYLEYTYYGLTGARRERVPLDGKSSVLIPLKITDPVGFVRFAARGPRLNNFLIKRITVTPDYRRFINNHLVRR